MSNPWQRDPLALAIDEGIRRQILEDVQRTIRLRIVRELAKEIAEVVGPVVAPRRWWHRFVKRGKESDRG